MPSSSIHVDVAFVGAGMIGSAASRHYLEMTQHDRERVVTVALIGPRDNKTGLARGQHFDVARITRRVDATHQLWTHWASESIHRYRYLEKTSGIPFYDPCGLLWLSSNEGGDEVQRLKGSLSLLSGAEKDNIHFFDGVSEFRRETPWAAPLGVEAFQPTVIVSEPPGIGGGTINPDAMVQAQIAVAAHLHSTRFQHLPYVAQRIERCEPADDARYLVTCTEVVDGALRVHEVTCNQVAVCCGSFSTLFHLLPHDFGPTLDVELVPELTALVQVVPSTSAVGVASSASMPSVISTSGPADTHFYCLPPRYYKEFDGWFVKLGASATTSDVPQRISSLEEATTWVDGVSTCEELGHRFANLISQLYRQESTGGSSWTLKTNADGSICGPIRCLQCVFDRTPTRLPFMGCVDGHGWYAALGGNGKAAKSSDELGRMLSAEMLGLERLPEEVKFRFKSKTNGTL